MLLRYYPRSISKFTTMSKIANGDLITKTNQCDYQAAIAKLNQLQSNATYIRQIEKSRIQTPHSNLIEVRKFIERSGLTLEQLDELSVIHVSGTKGKGSTCAFTESVLRHHGFKTGFYSSPHLFEVRERIRINGQPIEEEEFAKSFWEIYEKLHEKQSYPGDMPLYFRFLTVMAFHIFLQQKVDVAIIEVGIGGEYDCTNILRKVPVAGITSIGIDHEVLLGDTLESIAWHKAGIMKENSQVFTIRQPEKVLEVFRQRSKERNCSLKIVDSCEFQLKQLKVLPESTVILNISLAVALCESWIFQNNNNNNNGVVNLSKELTKTALESSFWPGRYQIKSVKNITYYLDGAHTAESIEICSNWFKKVSGDMNRKKVLLFNVTGSRNSEIMLRMLRRCQFRKVIFVPNIAVKEQENDSANSNYSIKADKLLRCIEHEEIWKRMEVEENTVAKCETVEIFPSILEAINSLDQNTQYDLLATGSLHLVGGLLSILEPNLYSKNNEIKA